MKIRLGLLALIALPLHADEPTKWWGESVEQGLTRAGDNRPELLKALREAPEAQRPGIAFLVAEMPDADAKALKAEFLLANTALAYKAREQFPWGKQIPEKIFLNDVLPYAHLDETREDWRKELYELCAPMVKDCKTPSDVAAKLNAELFPAIKVKYSTGRKKASQSPSETIKQGKASCTGLSIVLADACRAVGVPARLAGTANWWDKRGNHAWVEIWDNGWHFMGACEPDPKGLDRGWFVGDAAKAEQGSEEHGVFATSFRRTDRHFPLVWDRGSKQVPAEEVTERYAQKAEPPTGRVRVYVKVLDAKGGRIAAPVTVIYGSRQVAKGTSKDETADANDYLAFDLAPDQNYTIRSGTLESEIRTPRQGTGVFVLAPGSPPDAVKSAAALKNLRDRMDGRPAPDEVLALIGDSASVPLTKSDSLAARNLIDGNWLHHVRSERAEEFKNRVIKDGEHEMPFAYTVYGDKRGLKDLYISLHGGGNAPKKVNDNEWENQKKLYEPAAGVYVAPRAPTDTWNLWHEPHIDRMLARLIQDMIVFEGVLPDRVFLLGYSAGGDGVYQLAPRMADYWAAAAMMAGHPKGVSMLNLRNVPFAIQVGGDDSAYKRNEVAKEYGQKLDAFQKDDPQGYAHFVKIHEGKGHWMDREDKVALPWMAKFYRDPTPERVVWEQVGLPRESSYWLAVPPGTAKLGALVVAERGDQSVNILKAEGVPELLIHFRSGMVDLDRPIKVTYAGKELFSGLARRTIATINSTFLDRQDPRLMFDAEVRVKVPTKDVPK